MYYCYLDLVARDRGRFFFLLGSSGGELSCTPSAGPPSSNGRKRASPAESPVLGLTSSYAPVITSELVLCCDEEMRTLLGELASAHCSIPVMYSS